MRKRHHATWRTFVYPRTRRPDVSDRFRKLFKRQKLYGLFCLAAGALILVLACLASPADRGSKDGTGGLLMVAAGIGLISAKRIYIS